MWYNLRLEGANPSPGYLYKLGVYTESVTVPSGIQILNHGFIDMDPEAPPNSVYMSSLISFLNSLSVFKFKSNLIPGVLLVEIFGIIPLGLVNVLPKPQIVKFQIILKNWFNEVI
jgi:hypothetical protein